ncbi:hypothetical protein [Celerinatantimonas sp. MCCC 1A17872]|uniref:hypothetical protein n=1 Tax=Celerinatantimonas sp. MCCC 1A17872 TaxID=3177514 RepID=UPI0038BEB55F
MKKIIFFIFTFLLSMAPCSAETQRGVELLNQGNYQAAEQYFKSEADKGDVHARYWQANAMFLQRGEKAFAAGQIMLQAAKKGDPWAMNRLDPSNNESPCGMFGWPCDSKWLDKALATWKKQAKQGDGNAELALLLRDRPWYMSFIPVLGKKMYADKLIDAFKNGSDYAAFKILHTDIDNPYKYIKKLAIKGNCEAMYDYGSQFSVDNPAYLDWMKKATKCGYKNAAISAGIVFNKMKKYEKAYFYSYIAVYLGDNPTAIDPRWIKWVKDIPQGKIDELKSYADNYINENNIKPNKNYSEFSEEFFGIY